jgi:hypothetical protein
MSLSVGLSLAMRHNIELQAQLQELHEKAISSHSSEELDKIRESIVELAYANEELQQSISILALYNESLNERIALLRVSPADFATNSTIPSGEPSTAEREDTPHGNSSGQAEMDTRLSSVIII